VPLRRPSRKTGDPSGKKYAQPHPLPPLSCFRRDVYCMLTPLPHTLLGWHVSQHVTRASHRPPRLPAKEGGCAERPGSPLTLRCLCLAPHRRSRRQRRFCATTGSWTPRALARSCGWGSARGRAAEAAQELELEDVPKSSWTPCRSTPGPFFAVPPSALAPLPCPLSALAPLLCLPLLCPLCPRFPGPRAGQTLFLPCCAPLCCAPSALPSCASGACAPAGMPTESVPVLSLCLCAS